MYQSKIQDLMTKGFSLSNKWHFKEWSDAEFDAWVQDCETLLAYCEPEPRFPWFPDERHIEEIVAILGETRRKISNREITYSGL